MEYDYYEMNLENWANSIIELEEDDRYFNSNYNDNAASHASLVSLGTSTYYRTKGFSYNIGVNNLINAADPLITLITKLRRITIPPEMSALYQNICHEIKAFENKAQTLGYRSQYILAARYILSCTLDELLITTIWTGTDARKFSFIETFHKDMANSDRFFVIMERCLQDPEGHIDLLELIYLCIKLGYEGKYRGLDRGHQDLRYVTDQVYQVIARQREEFSRGLLISHETPGVQQLNKKNYLHLLPPAWIISTVMVMLLLVIFIYFYTKLVEAASPVNQFLNTIQLSQNPRKLL